MELEYAGEARGAGMHKTSPYISVLIDLFPLFALAFSIFFLKGISAWRRGCMEQSFFARFVSIVMSSAVGGAFAVGSALLLPFFDRAPDPSLMLGVVVFVSVAGMKIVDGVIYKKLGVRFIDTSDSGSADAEWMRMSPEERRDCMAEWRSNRRETVNE